MSDYLKEMFWGPLYVLWLLMTGAASLAAYLGLGSGITTSQRVLVVSLCSLVLLVISILVSGYRIYKRLQTPLKIKKVLEGSHYYAGRQIIILERAHWLRMDQLLTLFVEKDSISVPVCLIRIETFTSTGFPQCVVVKTLTNEDLPGFLRDDTRRSNLTAKVEIMSNCLERWSYE